MPLQSVLTLAAPGETRSDFLRLRTLILLRWTGPIGRHALQPDWMGNAAALLVVFVLVYVLLRVVFAAIAMLAPSRAARRAIAFPIPRDAPVISATFPSRRSSIGRRLSMRRGR